MFVHMYVYTVQYIVSVFFPNVVSVNDELLGNATVPPKIHCEMLARV